MKTKKRKANESTRFGLARFWPARIGLVLLALILADLAAAGPAGANESGSPADDDDPWAVLRLLEGTCEGTVGGKLGTGRAVRKYRGILGDQYLMTRHTSVRLPQEKSQKGDQHEEMGVFSFDRERQKIAYREFMIEGIISRYVCEREARKLVCDTEAVESRPGIRVHLVLEAVDRFRFSESCEIFWPGKEEPTVITVQWTRSPVLDN